MYVHGYCVLEKHGNANESAGSYVWQKGSIVGPMFKLPFMGPFLQSVNPKFEEYYAKWMSGPLSCVSVFHKYVWPYIIATASY